MFSKTDSQLNVFFRCARAANGSSGARRTLKHKAPHRQLLLMLTTDSQTAEKEKLLLLLLLLLLVCLLLLLIYWRLIDFWCITVTYWIYTKPIFLRFYINDLRISQVLCPKAFSKVITLFFFYSITLKFSSSSLNKLHHSN